jgi:hypothetical protein
VLQALFFCEPFRQHVLAYPPPAPDAADHLLAALARLFVTIAAQKRRTGVVPPRDFVQRLRAENVLFRGTAQQDAHEFLNFLLNDVAERLVKEGAAAGAAANTAAPPPGDDAPRAVQRASTSPGTLASPSSEQQLRDAGDPGTASPLAPSRSQTGGSAGSAAGAGPSPGTSRPPRGKAARKEKARAAAREAAAAAAAAAAANANANANANATADGIDSADASAAIKSFVHSLFEGALANETKCLRCDTVTRREESFLDLSLEIEQNSSITSCLRNFSATEMLSGADKFFCDTCASLQEAQKRTLIRALPPILALHLKRFKYIEELQRSTKLSYRVVFPLELRVVNTTEDCVGAERLYSLFAVVVHVGYGPNQGHYVCLVKSHHHWLLFDDDTVDLIDEARIQSYFGASVDRHTGKDVGYILFYGSAEGASGVQTQSF